MITISGFNHHIGIECGFFLSPFLCAGIGRLQRTKSSIKQKSHLISVEGFPPE